MLLAGFLAFALVAASWPGPVTAQAQPAQVEAVPAFDMFDLDSLQDPAIALPGVEPIEPPELESVDIVAPQGVGSGDPCRHFTQDERRRLPTLCGPSD